MGGSQQAVVAFAKRYVFAFAIDLGGGSDQHFRLVFVGQFEHVVRAHDIGFQRKQGVFDDVFDAHGGGEMVNLIDPGQQFFHQLAIQNAADGVVEIAVFFDRFYVFQAAGGQVVDDADLVAVLQKSFRQM